MAFLSATRREAIAAIIASGAGLLMSSCERNNPEPLESDGANDLRASARRLIELSPDASERKVANDWLAKSAVIAASKLEFADSSETHRFWANDLVLRHPEGLGLTLTLSAGRIPGGIMFHPWMHVTGYHVAATLNNQEIASISSKAEYFDKTLRFYQDVGIVYTPFPDTERLAIKDVFLDSFVAVVQRANLNPDDYRLQYARYYVLTGQSGTPRPLLAHAYTSVTETNITRVKRTCKLTYTTIV